MPKVRPLTQKQREAQAIEDEVQLICNTFLETAMTKRAEADRDFIQFSQDIGVSPDCLRRWRNGDLSKAGFGKVIAACTKMGYRLVLEPIPPKRRGGVAR